MDQTAEAVRRPTGCFSRREEYALSGTERSQSAATGGPWSKSEFRSTLVPKSPPGRNTSSILTLSGDRRAAQPSSEELAHRFLSDAGPRPPRRRTPRRKHFVTISVSEVSRSPASSPRGTPGSAPEEFAPDPLSRRPAASGPARGAAIPPPLLASCPPRSGVTAPPRDTPVTSAQSLVVCP